MKKRSHKYIVGKQQNHRLPLNKTMNLENGGESQKLRSTANALGWTAILTTRTPDREGNPVSSNSSQNFHGI